jgi:hypothetical protein
MPTSNNQNGGILMDKKATELKQKLNEVSQILKELGCKYPMIHISEHLCSESRAKQIISSVSKGYDTYSSDDKSTHWFAADYKEPLEHVSFSCFYTPDEPELQKVS